MRKTFPVWAWTLVVIIMAAAPACAKADAEKILSKAEAGDAQAQYQLAAMYESGQGTSRDPAKALMWYEKAAGAGQKDALVVLGRFYQHGEGGVDKDIAKALGYYQQAAEAGDAQAQVNLAALYETGNGVAVDENEALKYYSKAAGQGHPVAMLHLGVNYWKGKGVAQNYQRAWTILNKVRLNSSNKDAQGSAREALDEIKNELGVTADRSSYPPWEDLEFKK